MGHSQYNICHLNLTANGVKRGNVILLSRAGSAIGGALHVLCTHWRCGRSRAPSVYIAEFQRRQCHPPRHPSNNFPASPCTHQKCEFHLSNCIKTISALYRQSCIKGISALHRAALRPSVHCTDRDALRPSVHCTKRATLRSSMHRTELH